MKKAFTLLELLIIIGIIGLFLVLLVPSVSDAREAALDVKCKSNLRNLATLCVQYAQTHNRFPWAQIDPTSHDEEFAKKFGPGFMLYPEEDPALVGAKKWSEFQSYCWDFVKRSGEKNHEAGRMFPKGFSQTLQCPKCKGSDNWDGMNIAGYNYNSCYLGKVEGDAGGRTMPARWSSMKYPEKVVLFGDGGYAGGANKFMRAPKQDTYHDASPASLRKAGTQAFRHGSGRKRHCNMVFADCHVESFYTPYKTAGKEGWVDEQTYSAFISSGNGIYGPRAWSDEEDGFTENK